MRFVGRDRELEYLEGLYCREGVKTCMIVGKLHIGNGTRRMTTAKDAREKIADKRWKAQPFSKIAKDKGQTKSKC